MWHLSEELYHWCLFSGHTEEISPLNSHMSNTLLLFPGKRKGQAGKGNCSTSQQESIIMAHFFLLASFCPR